MEYCISSIDNNAKNAYMHPRGQSLLMHSYEIYWYESAFICNRMKSLAYEYSEKQISLSVCICTYIVWLFIVHSTKKKEKKNKDTRCTTALNYRYKIENYSHSYIINEK